MGAFDWLAAAGAAILAAPVRENEGGSGVVTTTPPDPQATQKVLPQIGASGTLNYDGYVIQSEYLPELRGTLGLQVWEEMRRSDPSVRETLGHIYAPIANADWVITPPEDPDDLEQEVTEFIRSAFFEWLDQPFEELLDQALSYLYLGAAVFETTFKVETRSLTLQKTAEADEGTPAASKDPLADVPPTPDIPEQEQIRLPERQFVTWRTFAQRLLPTIQQWHIDANEKLVAVTQQVAKPVDGGIRQEIVEKRIDERYLLVLTYDKQGGEFTGVSALRSAYKPWVLKQLIERTMGGSFERYGIGIPTAFVPADMATGAVVDRIEEMFRNIRAGDQNFLIFPEAEATAGRPGISFRIESPSGSFPDFTNALEYLRGEIAGALLTRFKELGQANVGSRATANTQAQVWYNLLHAIARYVESTFQVAIRRLVDMNYTGITRYPKLQASGIEDRNLLEYAQAITLLLNAEALVPDQPLRDWVRRTTNAPAEDKDEARARLQAKQREGQLNEYSTIRQLETDEPADTKRPRAENAKAASEEQLDVFFDAAMDRLQRDGVITSSDQLAAILARFDRIEASQKPAPAPAVNVRLVTPEQELKADEIVNAYGEKMDATLAAMREIAEGIAAPRPMRTVVERDPDTGKVIGSRQEPV